MKPKLRTIITILLLSTIIIITLSNCSSNPYIKVNKYARNGETDKLISFINEPQKYSKSSLLNRALLTANASGQLATLKSLISIGGDINSEYNDGMTMLASAAEDGYEENVKYLLSNGANYDLGEYIYQIKDGTLVYNGGNYIEYDIEKTRTGHNALSNAIKNKRTSIIKILLEHNCNPNNLITVKGIHFSISMDAIMSEDNITIDWGDAKVRIIDGHVKTNIKPEILKTTPLILAVETESLEIIKLLLDAGANVDGKGSEGRTAISVAAKTSKSNDIIKLLLEYE